MEIDLPRRGPFKVKGGYGPKEVVKGLLWLLFIGGIGAGIAGWGLYKGADLWRTADLWENGVEAAQAGLSGEVTTTNLVFKDYELDLQWITQEGALHKGEVEFFRWFTGPGQSDEYKVRYLKDAPEKAALSWAYEGRFHGWVFVLLLVGLGGGMLLVGVLLLGAALKDVGQVNRLARQGTLVAAPIAAVHETQNSEGGVVLTFTFQHPKLPGGAGTHSASGQDEMPWTVDEGQAMVILLDDIRGEHRVLREGGLPLDLS